MLYGNARITAIDADGKAFVADVSEGDLWNFPSGIPHSIPGLNPDGAEFLLVFDEGTFSEFATVLLTDWMAHTPKDVLAQNFGVKEEALEKLPKKELFIFQGPCPARSKTTNARWPRNRSFTARFRFSSKQNEANQENQGR
jgi:oxalate decarboxylase